MSLEDCVATGVEGAANVCEGCKVVSVFVGTGGGATSAGGVSDFGTDEIAASFVCEGLTGGFEGLAGGFAGFPDSFGGLDFTGGAALAFGNGSPADGGANDVDGCVGFGGDASDCGARLLGGGVDGFGLAVRP